MPIDLFDQPVKRVKAGSRVFPQAAPALTHVDAATGAVRGTGQPGMQVRFMIGMADADAQATVDASGIFEATLGPITPGAKVFPYCPQVGAGMVAR